MIASLLLSVSLLTQRPFPPDLPVTGRIEWVSMVVASSDSHPPFLYVTMNGRRYEVDGKASVVLPYCDWAEPYDLFRLYAEKPRSCSLWARITARGPKVELIEVRWNRDPRKYS